MTLPDHMRQVEQQRRDLLILELMAELRKILDDETIIRLLLQFSNRIRDQALPFNVTPDAEFLPPFCIDNLSLTAPIFCRPIVDELRDYRTIEAEGFDIRNGHLVVFIHRPEEFISFRNQHLGDSELRVIRSLIFQRTRIEFPTLAEILRNLQHVLFIEFRHVDFVMSSWRNQCDQEALIFGTGRRLRLVSFYECNFVEDIVLIGFTGTDYWEMDDDGCVARVRPHRTETVANRIPLLFYMAMFREGTRFVSLRKSSNYNSLSSIHTFIHSIQILHFFLLFLRDDSFFEKNGEKR